MAPVSVSNDIAYLSVDTANLYHSIQNNATWIKFLFFLINIFIMFFVLFIENVVKVR